MGSLGDYFRNSGYAIHRAALRSDRLPECCRHSLAECGMSAVFLDPSGSEILLPMKKCGVCGRSYALSDGKYIPIDSLLKYRIVLHSE